MILMLYFQKVLSPAAFYHAIFLFSWGSWQGEKAARSDLDSSLVFVCAAIQELGIQPYNEDLHLGELRYVQVRFCSFLGKSCLVSSFGTPEHKHGPNGPEGM